MCSAMTAITSKENFQNRGLSSRVLRRMLAKVIDVMPVHPMKNGVARSAQPIASGHNRV